MTDLIVTRVPNYVSAKIDVNNFKETEDLLNEINGLEHLIKLKFEIK